MPAMTAGPPTLLHGDEARGPYRMTALGAAGRGAAGRATGGFGRACRSFHVWRILCVLDRSCERRWNGQHGERGCMATIELTASFSTPSAILRMMFSTTDMWFPLGLSSRKRIIRHFCSSESQWTSTIRSSTWTPLSFKLGSVGYQQRHDEVAKQAHLSHSSSVTYS